MSEPIVGVLTGDIVKSRKIDVNNYDEMLYTLESTLRMLVDKTGVEFDIFRGDSFQAIFPTAADAIKGALIVRLALKAATPPLDVRQSIGIGSVSSLRHNAKSSTGEAFILSGNGLDEIKNRNMVIKSNNKSFQNRITLITKFLDILIGGLTSIQSETLLHYLMAIDKSHSAIASSLKKTRSNTTKLLLASHYQLVAEYLDYCDESLTAEFAP
ncbi:MAG: hypothetical protein ACI88A_000429 [Paraglaciecola sp.]|jgi:hypothetical protein